MDVKKLLRLLHQLGYSRVEGGKGSHMKLRSDRYPPLLLANHAGKEIAGGLVKKILRRDVGLSETEAREVISGTFGANDHH